MGYQRIDAKLRARDSMRGAYPHPMLVTMVYALATTILIGAIQKFTVDPFSLIYRYLLQGYDVSAVFEYLYRSNRMTIMMFLAIVISLYRSVMGFGYTSYSLRMARNEQPTYRNLLDGFPMAGRVILAGILMFVFTFLWELLAMVPFTAVLILAVMTGSRALVTLTYLLMLAAVVFAVVVTYRYRLAFYFLLDHPGEMTARQAITQSKLAMKGHKWDLFVLDLSFLGWSLLVPFTLGILALWLTPYMGAAEANFYDAVTGGIRTAPPLDENPPAWSGREDRPGPNEPF